jgi:3-phenylpropionate/trans-cinnamate dioxygenase ferredoxin reductase component
MSGARIVVIGAGQAGARAALALREFGHDGPITLVGNEVEAPYERPPLSKAMLGADAHCTRVRLHEFEHYAQRDIVLMLGRNVHRLLRGPREIVLDDGTVLPYDRCILATGGRARRWPGALEGDAARVITLRSIHDAHALRERLASVHRLAIVGGGFLGLECADAAASLGIDVTVLEAGAALLPDKMPAALAQALKRRHEDKGVRFEMGARITRIVDRPQRAVDIELEGAACVNADLCLIAIGQTPNVELALEAGLETGNGIHVDVHCRTSDPAIFAAGDCASFPSGAQGERVRLESWQNAEEQSRIAAACVLGHDVSYAPLPWFWTDQTGWNIQFLGLLRKNARIEWITRRWPASASTREVWMGLDDGGHMIAAVAINSGADMQPLRMLIGRSTAVDIALLEDPAIKLAKIAKSLTTTAA